MHIYGIQTSGYYVLGGYDQSDRLVYISTTTRKPLDFFRELKYRIGELNFKIIANCESHQKMKFIEKGLKQGLGEMLYENQQCA